MSLCTIVVVTWTWVRPSDPAVLERRPLLDLGCGDAQTLRTLVRASGLVVGLDVSSSALRAARASGALLLRGVADRLPFRAASFATILAGDLFHHLDDLVLGAVVTEIRRVLRDGGRLVAWWYQQAGREAADSPRYPRSYDEVAEVVGAAGLGAEPLELELTLEPAPPTVGILGYR